MPSLDVKVKDRVIESHWVECLSVISCERLTLIER